jgi:hypothetical protein
MTYSLFIAKIRSELKDFNKLGRDRWDGDGSTAIFELSHRPIKDASYTVKVDGVTKTEVTDYTLDKDTGILEFTSAPASGSDNVEITYRYYVLRDSDYIEIFNDAIDHFKWKFWTEALDDSTITTTKDQYEYDLSSISSNIIHIVNVWVKPSSGSSQWTEVQGTTNWKFFPERNVLFVNPPFDVSSLPLKFRYLKSFTKGTTPSSNIDVPEKWLLPYKYYCYARYYERMVSEKIHETGAVVSVPGFVPGPTVLNVAEYYYKKADQIANKLAPKLPPQVIQTIQEGVIL